MRCTSQEKNTQPVPRIVLSRSLLFGTCFLLSGGVSQIFAAQTNAQTTPKPEVVLNGQLPTGVPTDSKDPVTELPGSELPSKDDASKRLKIKDDVPEGFESIGGPTSNIVDLIFNGKNLGTVDITGNDETIRFDDPTVIAYLLPGIKDTEALIELLDDEFNSNVDKICFSKQDPVGCGAVEAAPVALIYDSGLLSVELFVAAELQSNAQRDETRYLPRPGENQSTILSLNAVASNFQDQEPVLDAATRAIIGYGNGYLYSDIEYNSSREQFRLRDLSSVHNFRDHELKFGAFSHSGGAGLLDIRLLGASFSTSLKSRLDLDYAFSSQLTVYLARRSVVQLVVDGRVYSGDTYDAGNQALDTRALPDGRYEVELIVIDPVSGPRSDRRIFTKNTQLPPLNESVYSITAGVPLVHPDGHVFAKTENIGVFGITWANRETANAAIEMGLHQLDDQLILHSKMTMLAKNLVTHLGGAIVENGTRIYSFQSSYMQQDFSADLQMEYTALGEVSKGSLFYDMFPNDSTQIDLSLNRSFGTTVVGVSSRYNKQLVDTDVSETIALDNLQYSFYVRRPIFTKSDLRGYVDGRLQKDDIGARASIQFRLFLDKPKWATNIAYTSERTENDVFNNQTALESSFRHTTESGNRWAVSGFANQLNKNKSFGSRVKLEHPRFQAAWVTQWTDASTFGATLNSVASLSMHLGVDEVGGAFSGTDYAESGVLIDVQGQPVGAPYDIIVNGLKLSAGKVGSAQMIGLQPFESYSVKLVPRGLLSNGIGESIYEFSLFPGNVERISVVAKNLVLLVTELVRENGDSVGDAVVEIDGNPLLIDAGLFQGELPQGEKITIRPGTGLPCQFTVPQSAGEDVLVTESPLICTTIE